MFYLKYIFFVVLFFTLGGLYHLSNRRFQTQKVTFNKSVFEIEKSNFLDTDRIKKKLQNFVRDSITLEKFLQQTNTLEKRILKNPAVRKADVSISLTGLVRVKVSAKKVVARVRTKKVEYYLDETYKPMKLSPFYTEKVLLITDTIPKTKKERFYDLIRKIKNQNLLKNIVVEIHRIQNGDYVMMTRNPKLKIIIGDLTNLKTKLKKLSLFYRWALQNKRIKNYRQLNLKYKNQVVCSKHY